MNIPYIIWYMQTFAKFLEEKGTELWVCKTSKQNVERESQTFDSILRFPWLGELGTLILFVQLHWDSGRFMLMNAPDSTIWPLQGNSGSTMEAQFTHLASRTTFAIRKRKIRTKKVFFTKTIQPWIFFCIEIDSKRSVVTLGFFYSLRGLKFSDNFECCLHFTLYLIFPHMTHRFGSVR